MKIKAIEAICKQHKHITLYNTSDFGQWISAGSAVYPLNGLPRLTEDNLFTIFDIPDEKRSKFYIESKSERPLMYEFEDASDSESLIEIYPMNIGGILVPIVTSLGVVYIHNKYLVPFKDSERGVDLYERINDAGELYIAVKEGFMLCGLIRPLDIITKEFSDSLCKLADLIRVSFENMRAKERDRQITITEMLGHDDEK